MVSPTKILLTAAAAAAVTALPTASPANSEYSLEKRDVAGTCSWTTPAVWRNWNIASYNLGTGSCGRITNAINVVCGSAAVGMTAITCQQDPHDTKWWYVTFRSTLLFDPNCVNSALRVAGWQAAQCIPK